MAKTKYFRGEQRMGQPDGEDEEARQEGPKVPIWVAGTKPKAPAAMEQRLTRNAALIAEPPRDEAEGDGHAEVTDAVGELDKARAGLADLERVLGMLVEDVEHPVADASEEEEAADEEERKEVASPVDGMEEVREPFHSSVPARAL